MRVFSLITLACLSACTWHDSRKPQPLPDPPEILVTGAPVGSIVFIDGVQAGQTTTANHQTQILSVAPGIHKLEIHYGDRVVYREDTEARPGERSLEIVKSGSSP